MFDKKQRASKALADFKDEKINADTFISEAYAVAGESVPLRKFSTNTLISVAYQLLFKVLSERSFAPPQIPTYISKKEESTALAVRPDESIQATSKEIEEKGKQTGKGKQEIPRTGTKIPNYYETLGVNENTSTEDIDKAFRNLAQQKHPDRVEGELRKQGLSTAEIKTRVEAANREFQDINTAYIVLGGKNNKNKTAYDDLRKKETAEAQPETTAAGQGGQPGTQQTNVVIELSPTTEPSKEALAKTKEFRELVERVGPDAKLDFETVKNLQATGNLPDGFHGSEVSIALKVHAGGGDAEDMLVKAEKAQKAGIITEEQEKFLNRSDYVVGSFEEARLKNIPSSEELKEAAGNPAIIIRQAQPGAPRQPNEIHLQTVEGPEGTYMQFAEPFAGKVEGKVKGKVASFVEKKLLKGTSVNALKAGGKAFLKRAGIKVSTKLGLAATGAGLPVVIAMEVGERVLKKLASYLPAFIRNGINNIKKGVKKGVKGALLFIGGLIAYAILYPIVVGIVTLIVGLIVVPLLVIFIIYIINTSSYVVPPFGGSIANPPPTQTNAYIQVTKTPNPDRIQNSQLTDGETVTYTVTITALQGTLTDLSISYTCVVVPQNTRPACPDPTPDPVTILPPGSQIQAGGTQTITYTQTFDSSFQDSIINDVITVRAYVSATPVIQTAATSATVIIGTPPIDCPLVSYDTKGKSWASYTPGNETSGHGSNAYWNIPANQPACNYGIPQYTGCEGPTDPAASNNICYSQTSKCAQYGFAYDVWPIGSMNVIAPNVLGQSQTWNCGYGFSNTPRGFTYICSSGLYSLVLTHLNRPLANGSLIGGTFNSGQQIGTLFPFTDGNTHLHMEFAINGIYQRPEDYFCF